MHLWKVLRFLLSAGCFLCCVVLPYAAHFRCMKIIPWQVKGKKKYAEFHHLLRLCGEHSQFRTEGWTLNVCLVNILTATIGPAVCQCSNFLSNSLLCMLWRYNGKESITWLWFGSFWTVRLGYRIHYSWWTTHTLFDQWKFWLIQKVNETTQTLCLCDTNIYCIQKAVNWTPTKTNMKMVQTLSLSSGTLFQEVTL